MTRPTRPSSFKQRLVAPLITNHLPGNNHRSVLLTFDDGPTLGVTPGVLERLAAFSARAAFFVVGRRAVAHPDLIRMIHQQGHAVGNHSHTHPASRLPWPGSYWGDVRQCTAAVKAATGEAPLLFRAPEGRLHVASLLVPSVLKMPHILWSLDSQDWRGEDETQAIASADRVLAEVQDGDIILLHEYAGWIHNLLDVLLPGLLAKGFDLQSGLGMLTGE